MAENERDPYWLRVLISLDHLVSVIFLNGDPGETISSRGGRAVLRTQEGHPLPGDWKWCLLCRLLDIVRKNHCIDSIGI